MLTDGLASDSFGDFVPPGFDSKPPEYQKAWLKRQIDATQKEIANLEAQQAEINSPAEQERAKEDLRKAKAYYEASKNHRGFGKRDNVEKPKWGELFGGLGKAWLGVAGAAALELKKQQLIEFEARYEALLNAPQNTPPPPPPKQTPAQKRAELYAKLQELEALEEEALKRCRTGPEQSQIKAAYTDRRRRILDELSKI